MQKAGRAETGGEKELADGSVTRSGYDAAGRLTAQTDAAGRRTEYGLNVVSGDITDITTPDGQETKFYYNSGNQLTAVVTYPDGLESRREYDEPGRLVSETIAQRETVRYRYDDAHSELPATTTDATGSRRRDDAEPLRAVAGVHRLLGLPDPL
ncbi:hypothetical protein GS568_12550 [Escherichia coli]|nr:hypothetical protein [Escherichia coli]